jgi:hypothetical protein
MPHPVRGGGGSMTQAAGERPAGGSAHRWSTGYSHHGTGPVTLVPLRGSSPGSGNARVGSVTGVDTLLGPEGTGVRACVFRPLRNPSLFRRGRVLGVQASLAAIPHRGSRSGVGVLVVVVGWFLFVF